MPNPLNIVITPNEKASIRNSLASQSRRSRSKSKISPAEVNPHPKRFEGMSKHMKATELRAKESEVKHLMSRLHQLR